MAEPTILEVFILMQRIGGPVASALATAWLEGSLNHKQRIEDAFPEFVRDYTVMHKAGHGVAG